MVDAIEARFDDLNGGGPATGEVCSVETLRDDFSAPEIDPDRWLRFEQNCALEIDNGALVAMPLGSPAQCFS